MYSRMKRILTSLMVGALALAGQVSQGLTTLTAGDLAIVGYATDSTDRAWFVNLVPIEAGTTVNLTQNACQSDGSFSTSENSNNATYTFASATPTGTITSFPWAGLSDDGDQIFIYQGTLSQANLICALSSRPWIMTGSTSANTSYKPSGLTEGTHYAAFATDVDNGYVTDLTGSRPQTEWLAYIHDSARWTRAGSRPGDGTYPSGTITVTAGGDPIPSVTITEPATEDSTVANATAALTLEGTSENAVGNLVWTNTLTSTGGFLAVGATWSIADIALAVGGNTITVTATNAAGTVASDSATITREAALTPSLTITEPVGKSATVDFATVSYELLGAGVNLAGTLTWSNALTAATGMLPAGGTWSLTVGLGIGVNAITVLGTNVNGTAASDSATITRNPDQVLASGDVAFVAFNADGGDGFAIVALAEIPANTTIYFCDKAWDNVLKQFAATEGSWTWVTGGTVIPAGTVVRFAGTDTASPSADYGTIVGTSGISSSGEGIFCYLGLSAGQPITFLAAVGNSTESVSFGTLAGTGLTLGDTAFLFGDDWDVAEYIGSRDDQTTFAAYRAAIYTAANWSHEDGTGDQNANGIAPDEPFNATAFTLAGQPVVVITTPAEESISVSPSMVIANLAGTGLNLAGSMIWSNALTTASGSFTAATDWSVDTISLDVGVNTITVTGTNATGAVATDSVTITREAITVAITDPANALQAVDNAVTTYTLSGTVENAVGIMTWTNVLTADFGTFAASANWSIADIALDVGDNAIMIGGTNAQGSVASDSVTVRRHIAVADLYAGDIAVTGFNADGVDNLAIVALAELPANTTIYLSDNTWYADRFGTTESSFEWNTGVSAIPAGTIVRFDSIANGEDASPLVSVSHGTIAACYVGNFGFSASGDTAYFFLGSSGTNAVRFLAAASTEASPNLTGTGLTLESTAVKLTTGCDIAAYTNARIGQISFAAYLPLVNDPANWAVQDGGGDQSVDSALPDVPFDATPFVLGAAAPELVVTTANGTVPYATATYSINGTFANLVGDIVWSNNLNDATGTATVGEGTWSATVPLTVGVNAITVTGTNEAGTAASDSVTVTRSDAPAASITITTVDAVVPYATTQIDFIEGSAVNAAGTMVLANSLGGGFEQPADMNWTFEEISLAVGVNTITITVTNETGVAATDSVTVIRQAEASADALRIATFSDPHYFATNLLIADGSAFQTYLGADRKLIAESAAITKATVDQIIARNANYVFVCGDLTKDGELASHVAFSNELARLENAGAQVLVIPGNHDIANPHAAAYDGAATTPVPSVTPAEFKAVYAPFGYDLATAEDADSVAYAVELTDDVALICMDSTQYGNITSGSFTNGNRLAWATNRMAAAKADGKLVLGMMHHGLMEHFQGQKQLFAEYVVDDYQTLAPLFAGLGMKAVFTGHFHANDIVSGTFAGKTIYDIETGSTVTWPCPYRVMELSDDRVLTIATHHVEAIEYDLGAKPDFQTYAYDYLATGMVPLSAGLLYQTFYPYLSWEKAQEVAPAAAEAMVAHYAGDEVFAGATLATQAKIVELMTSTDPVYAAVYQQIGGGLGSLLTDTPPADNNTTLNLGTAFWTLRISATGNGSVEPAVGDYLVEAGNGTNVLATAASWHRIASLTTNNADLAAAAGRVSYDAALAALGAGQTNHLVVTFAEATPVQIGGSVSNASLLAWARDHGWGADEAAAAADANLDTDHLLGLDADSGSYVPGLAVTRVTVDGSDLTVVVQLTTDGVPRNTTLNGTLQVLGCDTVDGTYVNVAEAQLDHAAFTGAGEVTRTFEGVVTPAQFYRVRIVPLP